jgi:DhnA family fructose-bisphosphate aldolase class Ia
MVEDALKAGAMGVSIGRNAFQHRKPEKMVAAMCEMVHNGASVKKALTILKS